MDEIIEDALKTTRTLHRLILTASLATIVFPLSLKTLSDEHRWKAAIDALIQADFLAYEQFVQQKVEGASQEKLAPVVQKISSRLEAKNYLIFNIHHISERFADPLHVGKFLTNESRLAEISATSLVQLNALNGLELAQDVQIVVPRIDELIAKMERFFNVHTRAGNVVDDISAGIDHDFLAQTFLPGESSFAFFRFDLVNSDVTSPVVFETSVEVDIHTIVDSSFTYWIEHEAAFGDVVSVESGNVMFGPTLTDMLAGYDSEELGKLSLRLADEIAKAGPESRSVSILGTQVSGLMIIFASPLALFFLAYYFMNHLSHLRNLAEQKPDLLRHFAWLPLTLQQHWTICFRGASCTLPAWILETAVSGVGLPIASLAMLYIRLSKFGGVGFWQTSVLLGAAAGILGLGILSLRHISEVRACIKI